MNYDNNFNPFKTPYAWLRQSLIDGNGEGSPLPHGLMFQVYVDLDNNTCHLSDLAMEGLSYELLMTKLVAMLLEREANSIEYDIHRIEIESGN